MEEQYFAPEIHQFKMKGKNIVLDVKTARVFAVDDLVYDILGLVGEKDRESIVAQLSTQYVDSEICSALDELRQAKLIQSEPFKAEQCQVEFKAERPISNLDLIVSQDCNMRCRYCFADTGAFHGERAYMSQEVGKAAIDFLLNRSKTEKKVHIGFFGGEPALNLPVLKYVVDYGEEKARQAEKVISFSISTNGTLLEPELLEYFNSKRIGVQISIDGDEETQNTNRPYLGNTGTYGDILARVRDLFRISERKVTARATVTATGIDSFQRNVEHLLSLGFHNVHFETASGAKGKVFIKREDQIQELIKQYEALASEFLDRIRKKEYFGFQNIVRLLQACNINGKKSYGCGAGRGYLSVGENGDLFVCHRFVGNKKYAVGNVLDDTYDSSWERYITTDLFVDARESCKNCWARYFCAGDCIAVAEEYFSDISKPDPLRCELNKRVVELSLMIYAHIPKEDKADIEKLYQIPDLESIRHKHMVSEEHTGRVGTV